MSLYISDADAKRKGVLALPLRFAAPFISRASTHRRWGLEDEIRRQMCADGLDLEIGHAVAVHIALHAAILDVKLTGMMVKRLVADEVESLVAQVQRCWRQSQQD